MSTWSRKNTPIPVFYRALWHSAFFCLHQLITFSMLLLSAQWEFSVGHVSQARCFEDIYDAIDLSHLSVTERIIFSWKLWRVFTSWPWAYWYSVPPSFWSHLSISSNQIPYCALSSCSILIISQALLTVRTMSFAWRKIIEPFADNTYSSFPIAKTCRNDISLQKVALSWVLLSCDMWTGLVNSVMLFEQPLCIW